ncbi:hypothetical protein [Streptomyces sp. NPDC001652]|uniref:hypothetical protein n=1 Tax=Streptomyces sp. NPDC001652 TaxID=3154393 RepID=UPI00331BDF36
MFNWKFSRRRPVQSPIGDQGNEPPVNKVAAAPTAADCRDEGTGLKNSIARGAAEGTAREMVRKFFEEFLN